MSTFGGLKLQAQVRQLRESLWFLPSITVVVALVLAELLGAVTLASDDGAYPAVASPDTARAILSTIATATITVTGLTFSITVLALQLAAGQYSPRLLRNFLADRGNQVVLSGLIGTFAYSLVLMRRVTDGTDQVEASVPALGLTLAIVLAVACVGLLVFFVDHVPDQLRVESIMERVARRTHRTIDAMGTERVRDEHRAPRPPAGAASVTATVSGHLQSVDLGALAAAASELGIHVRFRPWVGEFVTAGTTVAWWWPATTTVPGAAEVDDALRPTFFLGRDRTLETDVAFGMRQLVDIAVRAMSPAINDPTTASLVVENLSTVLARLVDLPLPDLVAGDDHSSVGVPTPKFAAYLDLAHGQIRRASSHEPAVVVSLGQSLRDLLEIARRPDRVEVLVRACDDLRAAVESHDLLPGDRHRIERTFGQLDDVLAGRQDATEAAAE